MNDSEVTRCKRYIILECEVTDSLAFIKVRICQQKKICTMKNIIGSSKTLIGLVEKLPRHMPRPEAREKKEGRKEGMFFFKFC